MRILPVLDVMRGDVVRGVGGQRAAYRPLVGRLTPSSRPLDVASALRAHFGKEEIYLADLDALAGAEPAWETFTALREHGFRLWVDAGVKQVTDACQLADAGVESVVVGLESVAGPAVLGQIVSDFDTRVVFSLDLRNGEPLGDRAAWQGADAGAIAAQAVGLGVRRLLVLDLACVGMSAGLGTRELCARLCTAYPNVEVSAGGGVRDRTDLEELRCCGVAAVLVASALHDGRLSRADLDGL